jgi:hypothetical protein
MPYPPLLTTETLEIFFNNFEFCTLPCLFGIRAGETNVRDARQSLSSLHIPLELSNFSQAITSYVLKTQQFYFEFDYYVNPSSGNIIDRILFQSDYSWDNVTWWPYTITTVMEEMGVPANVFIVPTLPDDPDGPYPYALILDYGYHTIEFYLSVDLNQSVCLEEASVRALEMIFRSETLPGFNPDDLHLAQPYWNIEESIGMTADEFTQIILDPERCFDMVAEE